MKKSIIISIIIIVIAAILVLFLVLRGQQRKQVSNFMECVSAGYPVIQTDPKSCRTPDKKVYTEEISNYNTKPDLIIVDNPKANQSIISPLSISGKARGFWFFEASFSVRLVDGENNTIAQGIAQARGDLARTTGAVQSGGWMTTNFVPFTATLEFPSPTTKTGTLILLKDNPSGLPENSDELRVPIIFPNPTFGTTSATTTVF